VYKGLLILSVLVLVASVGLTCLGYHAVSKWAQGLEGARLGEFAEVAEQIRQDVRRKLDEFIRTEQQRPYTDYLQYYVPDSLVGDNSSMPLLPSPLADQFANGLAYGYFQVEPDDQIITPYGASESDGQTDTDALTSQVRAHVENLRNNLLPVIEARREAPARTPGRQTEPPMDRALTEQISLRHEAKQGDESETLKTGAQGKAYAIESLQQQSQTPQVFTQDRSVAASNWSAAGRSRRSAAQSARDPVSQAPDVSRRSGEVPEGQVPIPGEAERQVGMPTARAQSQTKAAGQITPVPREKPTSPDREDSTVQIRIEPFVPVVLPGANEGSSLFGGQVFLLRRVQIEDRRLLQGFQLDEGQLVAEVRESAQRLMREGMAFALPQTGRGETGSGTTHEAPAYTAILDFGFGELIVALREVDPAWITRRISELRYAYVGIGSVVGMAVILALLGLWRATRAQLALAQKKDEFISAVSHELRTPLTSIRMYAEMLENNWLASKEKAGEYYRNIRQESERLSRLIENVLDFSRLQRGRKRYDFQLGDVNGCVADVVAMMRPYAAEHGFRIETDLGQLAPVRFDKDAVAQIVVNLLDNAVKYARSAGDKTIWVRTRACDGFAIVEVEDRGPGVPRRQQKRVFEQFYRCPPQEAGEGSQVAGTGLGLALVRRFAEAHDGFVEILSADPSGAIFRIGLPTRS
jgi:signal transduction histidine kinase